MAGNDTLLYALSVYPNSGAVIFYDAQNKKSTVLGYLNDDISSVYGVSFEYEREHDCFTFALFDMDYNSLLNSTFPEMLFLNDKISYIEIGDSYLESLILQSCAVYANMESYYEDISIDVLREFLFNRPCMLYNDNYFALLSVCGQVTFGIRLRYIYTSAHNNYSKSRMAIGVIEYNDNDLATHYNIIINNVSIGYKKCLICSNGSYTDTGYINICDDEESKSIEYSSVITNGYPYTAFHIIIGDYLGYTASGIRYSSNDGIYWPTKIIINNTSNVDYVKINNTTVFSRACSLTINPSGADYIYCNIDEYAIKENFKFDGFATFILATFTGLCVINSQKNGSYTISKCLNNELEYEIGNFAINGITHNSATLTGDAYLGRHGLNIYD